MDYCSKTTRPVLHYPSRDAWYAFGLWLRVGIVAAGLLATGVAHLLERIDAPAPALGWLIGGGALTAFAWHRARAALSRLDRAEAMADRTPWKENPRGGHRPAGAAPETLFGLSAAATALE